MVRFSGKLILRQAGISLSRREENGDRSDAKAAHPKKLQRRASSDSIAHISDCSGVALWSVVGIVGTHILYGLPVWLTSATPKSVLRQITGEDSV